MRILIIDDEFVSLMKLNTILEPYGTCSHATHGKQGIDMFVSAIKEKRPFDLLIIDIYLPDITGIKLLSYINSKEKLLGVPPAKKVIITAKSSLVNVKKAAQSHCDAFMAKPIRKDFFLEKMREIGALPEEEITRDEEGNLLASIDEGKEKAEDLTAQKDKKQPSEVIAGYEKEAFRIIDDIIEEEEIPPAERDKLRQIIKAEKADLFKLCSKDRIMQLYFDAIINEEIQEKWNEQKTNNS